MSGKHEEPRRFFVRCAILLVRLEKRDRSCWNNLWRRTLLEISLPSHFSIDFLHSNHMKHQKEHSKVKLPPIQEIYNRIIWDKRLNKKAFIIGFTDRMSRTGLREKPLIEWNTSDIEIPWHRIQYIRCG